VTIIWPRPNPVVETMTNICALSTAMAAPVAGSNPAVSGDKAKDIATASPSAATTTREKVQ
jgi:hypothetical protein